MHNWWGFFLDLGWLIVLFILFRHFWSDRQHLLQVKTWLKTKGHVTHLEWVSVGQSLWPKIEYTYQVNDKDIIGEYLFLDTAHNNPHSQYSRNVAYKTAIAFKENSEVVVYYNPNHPDESALDVTIPGKLNLIIFLIGIVMVFHVCLMCYKYFEGRY